MYKIFFYVVNFFVEKREKMFHHVSLKHEYLHL